MHAAENDHIRVRLGRLLREAERIAHEIRHVLDFRHLVIVREDDGVELLLERENFLRQRLEPALAIAPRGCISATSIMVKSYRRKPVGVKKINLRRPDIMEAVQAQVLSHYRSELVERIRANGGMCFPPTASRSSWPRNSASATASSAPLTSPTPPKNIFPAPHSPFICWAKSFTTRRSTTRFATWASRSFRPSRPRRNWRACSRRRRHHPRLRHRGRHRKKLEAKGCVLVDTTCGDVMSVWKRVRQYSKEHVTSIIHGKAKHEETKATTSQARAYGSGHYLVVFNLAETDYVCNYISRRQQAGISGSFKGAYSEGFDPDLHLQAVGVANQTTMLRGETEEVQRRIKAAMKKNTARKLDKHFRFFDTICGATQDRQDALEKLLREPMDLLMVIGGYNSSNTSHLAEMGEAKLPTYFIKNAAMMESDKLIRHYDQHKKRKSRRATGCRRAKSPSASPPARPARTT
jgi:4-hydroxy-3-methylbut-2-enyl diphosphate reductase